MIGHHVVGVSVSLNISPAPGYLPNRVQPYILQLHHLEQASDYVEQGDPGDHRLARACASLSLKT